MRSSQGDIIRRTSIDVQHELPTSNAGTIAGDDSLSGVSSSRVDRLLQARLLKRTSRDQGHGFAITQPQPPPPPAHQHAPPPMQPCPEEPAHQERKAATQAFHSGAMPASPTQPCPPGPSSAGSDSPPLGRHNLTIVSNRLPVSAIANKATGKWDLTVSAGGLVSALLGVSQHETRWVGWPGQYVPEGPEKDALELSLFNQNCIPVWLDKATLDLHYNGFCNSVLWQLFHYVPLQMDFKLSETHTLQQQWSAYCHANRMFAQVMLREHREGDIVWVQDYHLMLLPAMLKEAHPEIKVGFFLHTPFPSSEIYRTLPYREEVLRAVLKADLIGFHTYDYARHFISSCTRILGLEGTPYGVEENGFLTRVAAFPIGIDPERFVRALHEPKVASHISLLRSRYQGRQVMLGVDRLDMIKGIPQKLLAFEKFLDEHPEWHERVLLVQIAVPSRVDVPEYQHLRSTVHEIVGRINGKYGTLTHVPIHHLDRSLSFHELCALYAVTDVALVTSLRDGMNLVSYEYVACQKSNFGVLVLSEFAGAAQSLGAGSILVNPWNISDMAQAIEEALTMSENERYERWLSNYMHITIHTAQTWADNFISELNDTLVEAALRTSHQPPRLPMRQVVTAFHESKRRLVLLGYNTTLTSLSVDTPKPAHSHFQKMKAVSKVHSVVMSAVQALAADPANMVVISSGSTKGKLSSIFKDMEVWLAAENGVYLRPPPSLWNEFGVKEGSEWIALYENMNANWVASVQLVFDYFCERTPRSFVESRETSLVWNYQYADVEFGRIQAKDLLQHLWTGPISNSPVDIVQGARSVEVRMVGVNKGISTARMLDRVYQRLGLQAVKFDFVMCIGHFMARDEAVFSYFEGKNIIEKMGKQQEGIFGRTEHPSRHLDTFPGSEDLRGHSRAGPAGPPYATMLSQLSSMSLDGNALHPTHFHEGPRTSGLHAIASLADASLDGESVLPFSLNGPRAAALRPTSPDEFSSSDAAPSERPPLDGADAARRGVSAGHDADGGSAPSTASSVPGGAATPTAPSPPAGAGPFARLSGSSEWRRQHSMPLDRSLSERHVRENHSAIGLGTDSGTPASEGSPPARAPPARANSDRFLGMPGIPNSYHRLQHRPRSTIGVSSHSFDSNVALRRTHMERLRASQSSVSEAALLEEPPNTPSANSAWLQQQIFPPKHLFTVTVGRTQSLGRYNLSNATEVGSILCMIIEAMGYRGNTPNATSSGAEDLSRAASLSNEMSMSTLSSVLPVGTDSRNGGPARRPPGMNHEELPAQRPANLEHLDASGHGGALALDILTEPEAASAWATAAAPLRRNSSRQRSLQQLASMAQDGLTTVTEDSPVAHGGGFTRASGMTQVLNVVPPPGQGSTLFDSVGRPIPTEPPVHAAPHNGSPSTANQRVPSCDPTIFVPPGHQPGDYVAPWASMPRNTLSESHSDSDLRRYSPPQAANQRPNTRSSIDCHSRAYNFSYPGIGDAQTSGRDFVGSQFRASSSSARYNEARDAFGHDRSRLAAAFADGPTSPPFRAISMSARGDGGAVPPVPRFPFRGESGIVSHALASTPPSHMHCMPHYEHVSAPDLAVAAAAPPAPELGRLSNQGNAADGLVGAARPPNRWTNLGPDSDWGYAV